MSLIFAHRGFSGRYPENTMLAFEKMLETPCAGTELDVQLTSDNVPVIIHDERLERTTNGKGLVKEHTAAELALLVADASYSGKVPPQHIPTLREYFTLIKDTKMITNIELKTSVFQYDGIEKIVIDMARELGIAGRVWLSSFNHYTIKRCLEYAPEIKCGLLIDCWIVDIGEYAQRLGATTVNAEVEFLLEQWVVEDLHNHGIGAQAWTANRPEQVKALVASGVECIITNFPDMGCEVAGIEK